MASVVTSVVRLSDLEHGQEAVCFAALVKKDRGVDKNDKPYVKCHFRDKRVTYVAPFWSGNALRDEADGWAEGIGYRLHLRANYNVRWGMQIEVFEGRPAVEADEADGYNFFDLVESSQYAPEALYKKILEIVDDCIDEPPLKQLVLKILADNADLFKKMQAAKGFHHAYTGGLIEHVWSMTRIASLLAKHYGRYYDQLDPPLNKGVVVAAAVLHDIGKLKELAYDPVEAKYTTEGCLIGHILMGRDLVVEAARGIPEFPRQTLLLLEHAILAHHGKREYGSPIIPQTMEALLVSFIDDLDAKMNAAARARLNCTTEGEFTDKVWPLDNRQFYKGVPVQPPADDEDDEADPC